MKQFVFYLLLLACNISFCQDLLISYNISTTGKLLDDNKKEKLLKVNQDYQETINKFDEASTLIQSMNAKMKVSQKESLFWFENNLSNDVNLEIYMMAEIMVGAKEKIHCNNGTNEIQKAKHFAGKNFVITTYISDFSWKITKETKQIGNYTCFKAEYNYKISNNFGDFDKKVTAWYTTEIPLNFGPKGYCGLPGLILELTDDKIVYTVSTIERKNNLKIENLERFGKKISAKEFLKITNEITEEKNNRLFGKQ